MFAFLQFANGICFLITLVVRPISAYNICVLHIGHSIWKNHTKNGFIQLFSQLWIVTGVNYHFEKAFDSSIMGMRTHQLVQFENTILIWENNFLRNADSLQFHNMKAVSHWYFRINNQSSILLHSSGAPMKGRFCILEYWLIHRLWSVGKHFAKQCIFLSHWLACLMCSWLIFYSRTAPAAHQWTII